MHPDVESAGGQQSQLGKVGTLVTQRLTDILGLGPLSQVAASIKGLLSSEVIPSIMENYCRRRGEESQLMLIDSCLGKGVRLW